MADIVLRQMLRRTPQQVPQIDWSNPLTRGLLFVCFPQASAFIDVTARAQGLMSGSGAAAAVGRLGRALDFNATAGVQIAPATDARFALGGECTLVALCTPDNAGGGSFGQYVLGSGDSSAASSQAALRVLSVAGAYWGGSLIASGATSLVSGVPAMIGMSRSGSTGAWTAGVWLNGRLDGSASTATNPAAQQVLALGSIGAATGFGLPFDGMIFGAWIWNRALGAAEMASLYENPSQIYRPRAMLLSAGAGGGIAGAIAESCTSSSACGAFLLSAAAVAEAVSVMEAQISAAAMSPGLAETSPGADLSSVAGVTTAVVQTEAVAATDLALALQQANVGIGESTSSTDTATAAGAMHAALVETGAAVDSANPAGSAVSAAIIEAAAAAETVSAGAQLIAAIAEAGVAVDAIWAALAAAAATSETAPTLDTAAGTLVSTVHLADVLAAMAASGASVPSGQISALMRYTVEAEDRVYVIAPDDRRYVIVADARTYTVN